MKPVLRIVCGLVLCLCLAACGQRQEIPLSIVSGSENKSLEPLVKQLGRAHGVNVAITYLGSVDIAREIQKGTASSYDAVWPASSIALNAGGKRLLDALQDPDMQRLAWERHGFRSGLLGVQNDPKPLQVIGLPETINAVIPMPHAVVMQRIVDILSTRPQ